MIHLRENEVPDHPVIVDMERYGVWPYRRRPEHFIRRGRAVPASYRERR